MTFGPGHYFIRLHDGVPSLFTAAGRLIDPPNDPDPTFETVGSTSLTFTIDEIDRLETPLVFTTPFISWKDIAGNPPGNTPSLDGEKILTLTVNAPTQEEIFQFTFHTSLGNIDPTIVEKPPEPPPPPPPVDQE